MSEIGNLQAAMDKAKTRYVAAEKAYRENMIVTPREGGDSVSAPPEITRELYGARAEFDRAELACIEFAKANRMQFVPTEWIIRPFTSKEVGEMGLYLAKVDNPVVA